VGSPYSRDQLLDLYRAQNESGDVKADIEKLYVGSWEPNLANGAGGPGWGRRDDHGNQSQAGVDACWEKDGNILPLGIDPIPEDEREVGRSFYHSLLNIG
jgi:PERQ amino acid-rich with GYF domain-containing protein